MLSVLLRCNNFYTSPSDSVAYHHSSVSEMYISPGICCFLETLLICILNFNGEDVVFNSFISLSSKCLVSEMLVAMQEKLKLFETVSFASQD